MRACALTTRHGLFNLGTSVDIVIGKVQCRNKSDTGCGQRRYGENTGDIARHGRSTKRLQRNIVQDPRFSYNDRLTSLKDAFPREIQMDDDKPTDQKITVHHKTNFAKTTFETIKVTDEKRKATHFILIETTTTSTRLEVGEKCSSSGTIEVRATYLFGSQRDFVGKLVSEMGGNFPSYRTTVKLTNGGVQINSGDLRGIHIGSYMFNKIVAWAKEEVDSSYGVITISLSRTDAEPDNLDRRNKFYENFGIRFVYRAVDGIEKAEGSSDAALTVADLIARPRLAGIEMQRRFEGLDRLGAEFDKLRSECRGSRRIARACRKKLDSVEWYPRAIGYSINWVAYAIIAYIAFCVGKFVG